MSNTGDSAPQDRLPHASGTPQDPWNAPMPVIGERGLTESTSREVAVPTPVPAPVPAFDTPPEASIVSFMGDTRREGMWRVNRKTAIWTGLGDITLDLRDAVTESPILEFDVKSIMGDVTLVVAPGTDVRFRGFTALGDQKIKDLTEPTSTPVPMTRQVIVTAYGLMGDVTVKIVEPGRPVPSWWQQKRR